MSGGTNGSGRTIATTVYVSDGNQEIAEYAAGSESSAAQEVHLRRLRPRARDDRKRQRRRWPVYYYHQNNLLSVAALTGSDGKAVERYAYTAYGKPTVWSDDGNGNLTDITTDPTQWKDNPYLFTGHRYDPETGLYYCGSRYYDPGLGRFISRDPIGSGVNLYEYSNNDPLGYGSGGNLYGYLMDQPTGTGTAPPVPELPPIGKPLTPGNFPRGPQPIPEGECCQRAYDLCLDEEDPSQRNCLAARNGGWKAPNGSVWRGWHGNWGGTICCNGKLMACAWTQNMDTVHSPNGLAIMKNCTEYHESQHFSDVMPCCSGVGEVSRPARKFWITEGMAECPAFRAELACLISSRPLCKGDKTCETEVENTITFVEEQIDAYCGHPDPKGPTYPCPP